MKESMAQLMRDLVSAGYPRLACPVYDGLCEKRPIDACLNEVAAELEIRIRRYGVRSNAYGLLGRVRYMLASA